MREITFREALNETLRYNLAKDDRVFCWGQDIGILGGAFGVTAGLINEFGKDRIIDTPISEIAIVGAGIGAALGGLKPVIEVMYIDFTPGCMDMIVNQMSKIHYMFGAQCEVPMVLRVVSGAMGNNAAQHSQSFYSFFVHIPGLIVVTPTTPYDAKGLLNTSIASSNPVIFIENKRIVNIKGEVPEEYYSIPFGKAEIRREGSDLTIVATQALAYDALKVATDMEKEGVSIEVIDPRTLKPLDKETIFKSVEKTGKLIVADEGIKKDLIENIFSEKNYPPTVTFGGSKDGVSGKSDLKEKREASHKYYKQLINFYYKMGFSVLADYEFLVNFQAFNTVGRVGKDQKNSPFAREERHWAQEGIGLLKDENDFDEFPWEKVNELVENYADHLEFLDKNLPDGMTIAVVGSVLEQVMEWLLGYEGVLYSVYDNPKFLESVFNKVGQIVFDLYKIAIPLKRVGIIWHGDDLGFKTGTILSPDHLRKYVFPWFSKYAELAHKYNKPIWFHACGNKTEVMKDFIYDIKFDAIHSFEDSCCSIIDYKKNYGGKIALLGGVDIDKLTRLEEDDLRNYIKRILNNCMPGGRFALGSGNSISNYIPVKNFLIMLEEGINFR